MIKRVNLSVKLCLIYTTVLTLIVLGLGTFSYLKAKSLVKQQEMNDLTNTMLESSKNIDRLINNINKVTQNMFFETSITDLLTSPYNNDLKNLYDIKLVNNHFERYIDMFLGNSFNSYSTIFFLNAMLPITNNLSDGSLPKVAGITRALYVDTSVMNESWYKNVYKLDGTPYWFFDENLQNFLYIARLVKNPAITRPGIPTEAVGVAAIGFDVTQFQNSINSSRLTNSAIIILTDSEGNILYSSDKNLLKKQVETYYPGLPEFARIGKDVDYFTYNGSKYMICANTLQWNWKFFAMIPEKELSDRVNIIIRIIIFSILAAIFIGILISIFVSNRVSQPIKKLAKIMKSIKSESNIGIFLSPPSQDEVGTLYESFNEMMARIDNLVSEVYKSTLQQKASELRALQAQINPHFLYNTLDSVCWLALRDGNDKIAGMLSSLASIMRYSIKDAESIVTISEEIENIKHYAKIKELSSSFSFIMNYDIAPDLSDYNIPKFIIQPLVENSFVHGISKTGGNGEIIISIHNYGNCIKIIVKDTGHCDRIDELNDYLLGKKTTLADSDGFGIRNVNDRIKMRFGDEYGLKYEKDAIDRTTAVVTLP